MATLYKNARLIDADGARTGVLLEEHGRIAYVGPEKALPHDTLVDVHGAALMPALIDLHCHLRDPGYPEKETMESGMRAALKGGYATLCAMANTNPILDTPALIRRNMEKAQSLRLTRLVQAAAAGLGLKDETHADYAALRKETCLFSNDGNTIFSDAFMRRLLLASREYGFLISTHCQPEREIVRRDIALLKEVGGNLHVGHISHRETVAMIRAAKAEGVSLTCEATPHHLFGWGDGYKVNPPLRQEADVQALIEGILDGTVDCLATDHAPHTAADKAAGAAGVCNMEYAAQMYLQVFYENHIPLTTFARMSSYNPAKRLGLKAGLLQEGYPADLVALDTEGAYTLREEDLISKSSNTPFFGRQLRGRVLLTIVEGETRYEYR